MSIYTIVFSPTGGTQKVADAIAADFGQEITAIDLSDSTQDFAAKPFTAEDICFVAVPSFGGRVPAVAASRLKQMSGGNARAIMVVVYGNRAYDDTLLELHDTLIDAGFCCVAGVAAVAEHSIMHQFAAGRPDADDGNELATFGKKIRQKIEDQTSPVDISVPGNKPYREYGGLPMKPSAGKTCIQCGICAAKCPVNAIPVDNPSTTDEAICISCMRCIAICPSNARSVNKLIVAVAAKKMKKACTSRKENELFL